MSFPQEYIIPKKTEESQQDVQLHLSETMHTLLCGIGYLQGYRLMREVMQDKILGRLSLALMSAELGPATAYENDMMTKQNFDNQAFISRSDEFSLLPLTAQYSSKMRVQVTPLLWSYYHQFNAVPCHIACGFAGYILFMKVVRYENGKYFGERNGEYYPIQCDSASVFYNAWQLGTISHTVRAILSNEQLWGVNLTTIDGFAETIIYQLSTMLLSGIKEAVASKGQE